jgi:hypothetical protein
MIKDLTNVVWNPFNIFFLFSVTPTLISIYGKNVLCYILDFQEYNPNNEQRLLYTYP